MGRSLEMWGSLNSCLHRLHGQGHCLGLAKIGVLTLHFCFVTCGVGMVALCAAGVLGMIRRLNEMVSVEH